MRIKRVKMYMTRNINKNTEIIYYVTFFKISFGLSYSYGVKYVVARIATNRAVKIDPTKTKTEIRMQNSLFRFDFIISSK